MANRTLTQATALAGVDIASNDELWIWDVTAAALRKCTRADLIGGVITGGGTVATGGFTLTVPATGTAALVSENTFTPSIAFGGASTGITYASSIGYYIRVGNCVFISIDVRLTNKGTATGNATITNLPFTSSAVASNPFLPARWINMTTSLSNVALTITTSATTGVLLGISAAGASLNPITDTAFANNSIIQCTGYYFV